jgi:nitroreductase
MLETILKVLSSYRSSTHFRPDPIAPEIIERLVECARLVPTDWNLQPAHYYIVTDDRIKNKLWKACLKQSKILEAPVIVVFSASRMAAKQFEPIIVEELKAGSMTIERADSLRENVKMLFDTGPCWLGWIAKSFFTPLLRFFTPMPRLPAVHKRAWLTEQVMRSATTFWYAAQTTGLAADWVNVYDEWRIKRALGLPWHHIVVSVMVVGHAREQSAKKVELPIEDALHWNKW